MSGSGEPGRVPEPTVRARKQRRSAFVRVLGSFVGLLVLAGSIIAATGFYGYSRFVAQGPLPANKIYMVEAGQGQQDVGAALEKEGIIANGLVFTAGAYLNGLRGQKLRPGEYEFPAQASMEQVLAIITSGKAITYKLTVPEGWTSEMAVARVNENEVLTGDPATTPPEGSIMPDTYVFRRGMTRAKLVADMQTAQTKLINQLWEERDQTVPLKTKEEAVALASIVEKETGVATERPLVASVFINRLKQGIRLQSDPTIIYGLVGGKGKLERPLTRADIDGETPYNTYRIAGLPPGPIANPGKAALEAVLNPPTTNYVYFVANGTGGHAFAETLAEHNSNVAKWRAIENGQGAVVTTEAAASDAAASTGMPALPAAKVEAPATAEAAAPATETPAPVATADPAAAQPVPAPATTPPETAEAVAVAPEPSAAAPAEPQPSPEPAQVAASTAPEAAAEPEKPESVEAAVPAAAVPKPPAKPDLKATGAVAAKTVLQPGTIVKVADQMVPIPRQKPKK